MRLEFNFSSIDLADPQEVDSAVSCFKRLFAERHSDRELPLIEVDDEGIIQIAQHMQLRSDDDVQSASLEIATTVEIFDAVASEYSMAWKVGHQLEPHLGTIGDGGSTSDVIAEARTAIQVARSLSEMIVDDEFVEPDSVAESPVDDAIGEDGAWSELLESPDAFIRFPEFE